MNFLRQRRDNKIINSIKRDAVQKIANSTKRFSDIKIKEGEKIKYKDTYRAANNICEIFLSSNFGRISIGFFITAKKDKETGKTIYTLSCSSIYVLLPLLLIEEKLDIIKGIGESLKSLLKKTATELKNEYKDYKINVRI